MTDTEVRPAQAEDRETVLAFCSNTWVWGDYIERVWDEWLNDSAGLLLTATVDGQPAGIVHLHMIGKTDGWLEGLRVDPQYRRQGIARALNEAIMLAAMKRGVVYVRLAVESENTASMQLAESMHMRKVGSFAIYTALPPEQTPKRPMWETVQLATKDDLDHIIDYLNVSNIFPSVGGLYYVRFTAYPITAALLEEKISAGQIYLLRRWDRLDGLAIAEPREEAQERRLSIGYIDGTTIEAISLLAYDLRRRLSEMKLARVRAYVPDLVLPRDAFTGVEYEWDGSVFYTYERGLV